jgi:hypothetical protein
MHAITYCILFGLLASGLGEDEVLEETKEADMKIAHSCVIESGTG